MDGHHIGGCMKDIAKRILTLTQGFLQPVVFRSQFVYFPAQTLYLIRQDNKSPKNPKFWYGTSARRSVF
jgi:hypothetical protein